MDTLKKKPSPKRPALPHTRQSGHALRHEAFRSLEEGGGAGGPSSALRGLGPLGFRVDRCFRRFLWHELCNYPNYPFYDSPPPFRSPCSCPWSRRRSSCCTPLSHFSSQPCAIIPRHGSAVTPVMFRSERWALVYVCWSGLGYGCWQLSQQQIWIIYT